MKTKMSNYRNCFALAYVLLVAGLSSCGNKSYNDTDQSKFVVKEVKERNGMSKMTSYKVLMLDASGLGETHFWITDSLGKYKVGDGLWLQPCH